MQFHYAYPENVFKSLKYAKPSYYKKMINYFELTKEGYDNEVTKIIEEYNKLRLKVRNELADIGKAIEEKPIKVVSEYLWSELILQIQGKENTREIFKHKITDKLQTLSNSFENLEMPEKISVKYFQKSRGSWHEVIDIICNLVYKHGAEPGKDCPI